MDSLSFAISSRDLQDISEANGCPLPVEDGWMKIMVFSANPVEKVYPGIGVQFGEINIGEEFSKHYDVIRIETNTYEEFTHSNRIMEINWHSNYLELPDIKLLSEKFEYY